MWNIEKSENIIRYEKFSFYLDIQINCGNIVNEILNTERFFKYRWPIVLCRSNCAEVFSEEGILSKICKFQRKKPAVAYFLVLQLYWKRNVVALFFLWTFRNSFFYITPPPNCCMWHLFFTDFIGMVLFSWILILWFLFSINDGEEIC